MGSAKDFILVIIILVVIKEKLEWKFACPREVGLPSQYARVRYRPQTTQIGAVIKGSLHRTGISRRKDECEKVIALVLSRLQREK